VDSKPKKKAKKWKTPCKWQWVRINLDLAVSEIMRKTQAHRPVASRAADGGVSRVWSVMAARV